MVLTHRHVGGLDDTAPYTVTSQIHPRGRRPERWVNSLTTAIMHRTGATYGFWTKNRFQNVAHISNRLERTLAPSKYTASGAAEDLLCTSGGDCRHLAGVTWRVIRYSSRSSAERSSVRAFERITSAASSRESPPMSVSHTKASMPIVAPIP